MFVDSLIEASVLPSIMQIGIQEEEERTREYSTAPAIDLETQGWVAQR